VRPQGIRWKLIFVFLAIMLPVMAIGTVALAALLKGPEWLLEGFNIFAPIACIGTRAWARRRSLT
jgi:hypothetical protein